MRDIKSKAKFIGIFTLTMCFVLTLIALPMTLAYLSSHKYVGGSIDIATINLDVQNSSSATVVDKTIEIGEADSTDTYNCEIKLKNTGNASIIVRFYVGLIDSSGNVVKTNAIEPLTVDGTGYGWIGADGYYYLSSTTDDTRLTVAKDASYNMLRGFTISDPDGTLDSSIDDDGNLTFGLQVQCIQYNVGTEVSSIWNNLPGNW